MIYYKTSYDKGIVNYDLKSILQDSDKNFYMRNFDSRNACNDKKQNFYYKLEIILNNKNILQGNDLYSV